MSGSVVAQPKACRSA